MAGPGPDTGRTETVFFSSDARKSRDAVERFSLRDAASTPRVSENGLTTADNATERTEQRPRRNKIIKK